MRAALDRIEPEIGRYVRLVNYCSGLCMPEIAAMGALERLDMMLNDALYGIIFRDINPFRTLIDQNFSRRINAAAGVVINTGEDNYLTTADAVEQAPAVLASQFINERLALDAGLERLADRARARVRDRPDARGRPPLRDRPGPGGARDLPGRAAQVHAADQAHDRQRLPRLPAERALRPHLRGDRTVDPPARHADRSAAHAAPLTTAGSRSTRRGRIRANARHLEDEMRFRPDGRIVRRAHAVLEGRREAARADRAATGSSTRSRPASSPTRGARATAAGAATACSGDDPEYSNPFREAWDREPAGAPS